MWLTMSVGDKKESRFHNVQDFLCGLGHEEKHYEVENDNNRFDKNNFGMVDTYLLDLLGDCLMSRHSAEQARQRSRQSQMTFYDGLLL